MNKFYITTPIYYVNSKPHLGTLYSTLLADVIARWQSLRSDNVFFLTGLDEHGQKIAQVAQEKGLKCQTFVDSMVPAFQAAWQTFGIEYSHFIRTTDRDHKTGVYALFDKIIAAGDIYKSCYKGNYCIPCETFVNDADTASTTCPTCQRLTCEVSEESYFFKLSSYQQRLLDFYTANPNFITPSSRFNEVISFVKEGLKDLCISRKNVKWGIPFPNDPDHTIYVWGDALVNYISGVGFGQDTKLFAKFWPADVHVMAKDIVRFHAVYWPAMLMAAGLALPKRLLVHGYILVDQKKMSKSLGNAIDPFVLAQTYGVDQVRYYLMRHISVTQDGSFSTSDLETAINADLANNLGNLLSRAIGLCNKRQVSTLSVGPSSNYGEIAAQAAATVQIVSQYFNDLLPHMALAEIFKFLSFLNAQMHNVQPWTSKDTLVFEEFLSQIFQGLSYCAVLLHPVMPEKMTQLLHALGLKLDEKLITTVFEKQWHQTFHLQVLEQPLFARYQAPNPNPQGESAMPTENTMPSTPSISIEDVVKVQLVVGKILSCQDVEKSDKLYRLEVDFGTLGQRQVVSGIKKYFSPEYLINRHVAFVGNLAPRKIMGLESQAMILVANDGKTQSLATFEQVTPGTILS